MSQMFFCFLKKLCMRQKQVASTFVSMYFRSPQLGFAIKTNYVKAQTVDPETCSILIF